MYACPTCASPMRVTRTAGHIRQRACNGCGETITTHEITDKRLKWLHEQAKLDAPAGMDVARNPPMPISRVTRVEEREKTDEERAAIHAHLESLLPK